MKFSPSTRCFYPEDIQYDVKPPDLIEVTRDQYHAAMNRAAGETLDILDGQLVIVPAPVVSAEEQLARAKIAARTTSDQIHSEMVQKLLGYPTEAEKNTWTLKLDIAHAVIEARLLRLEQQTFFDHAGISTEDAKKQWADSVLAKSAHYITIFGRAEQIRETARVAIKGATNEESIQVILNAQRTVTAAIIEEISKTP